MFNEAWIQLALLMLLVGAAFGQEALLSLGALLITILPVAWAWQRVAFWRVKYERLFDETRVFVGEEIHFSIRLTNRKPLPLAWVKINERMPLAISPRERPLAPSTIPLMGDLELRASLNVYERARWDFTLPCNRRGIFRVGPTRLSAGDLFGLFSRQMESTKIQRVVVYPRVRPLTDWGLPAKEPFGESLSRIRLFEDPTRVRGLRDYAPGDPPKYIHWPASAHYRKLQVKVHEPTIHSSWMVVLNISTYAKTWQGIDTERAEAAISLAASIAAYADEHRYSVGVLANGSWPESDQRLRVLPGRGPDQLRRVLEAFAAVSSFVTAPIETLLASEAPKLPWGATLIVVTAIVTDPLLAEIRRLADVGRKMVLISMDENWEPEQIPGVVVRQARAETDAPAVAQEVAA